MTMQYPAHPDDERLSALAGADLEATDDAALTDHVAACDRCREVVDELRVLRMALADLPDMAPSRPLRLLPPAGEPSLTFADRLAGVVRRAFAPAVTAGAALALVGVVGTTFPAIYAPAGASPATLEALDAPTRATEEGAGLGAAAETPADFADPRVASEGDNGSVAPVASVPESAAIPQPNTPAYGGDGQRDVLSSDLPAERSPWPMVLFTGVALMIVAVTLRWILVPRAG